jgi:hypothetical protein
MENQHRKISGYRELTAEEIDLMNRIKAKGAELLALQAELVALLEAQLRSKKGNLLVESPYSSDADRQAELRRFEAAEPMRWVAIGKTDIQTGIMALVRAVAQPEGV